ncbi:septum site-determining protein Ssd [Gordonia sp. (in: high G+C Gram-positive bacteria)]|uniref:septum site-determining protein Ssd n=1 Tax=Gordonia sp. (in: high G+C Gram-positive bacteria) TaxID=84139 RepID=UPI002630578B|nr:septum site-determining protein Ssd [Gordonia sp. (in: high G+C Gram-positive bacteria)]
MSETLLVLTGEVLQGDVARCGAAAGYRIVVGDPARCRHDWLRAGAVVVDGDALGRLTESRLPARPGVLVVSGSGTDARTWRNGLAAGAQGGYVLPDDEAALVAALSAVRQPRRGAAPSVALVGGHGGAGVSTMAVVLAQCASRSGSPVLLLDAEPGGAGLDLLLGAEDTPGLRWGDITGETGSIAGQALSAALPRCGARLRFLTSRRDDGTPLSAETVLTVVDAARAHGDTVIADAGRAVDAAALGVLDSADLAVVMTTASVPAVAATRKLVTRARLGGQARLLVRGPAPGGLSAGQVAEAVGLPLLAALRSRRALARSGEEGGLRPGRRGPETVAARAVLDALAGPRGGRR